MVKNKFIVMSLFLVTSFLSSVQANWFKVWDRPEYQEWAKPISEGYELHIIRKEPDNYLVVKAKLIMGEKGLPGFEVVEQTNVSTKDDALKQIELWK